MLECGYFHLDGPSIELDEEGPDVAHARVLHEHAKVPHVLHPSARKWLVDVFRNRHKVSG